VTGEIIDNLCPYSNSFRKLLCLKGQRHRVLKQINVSGSRHPVAGNSIGIASESSFFRVGKEFSPGTRHMTILACLSGLLVAIGALQPLPKGIVNNGTLKNSKMAWGAELATLLKPGICVLARRDIVQGPGKELMSFERSPEFVGKYSGSVRKRKPCG